MEPSKDATTALSNGVHGDKTSISPHAPPLAHTMVHPTQPGGAMTRSLSRVQMMRRELSASKSVLSVGRAMSSMWKPIETSDPTAGIESEETFRCYICCHDIAESEAVVLTTCGHKYCHPCLTAFLETRIKEDKNYPLCFHPVENALVNGVDQPVTSHSACGTMISQDQIKAIVNQTTYHKYLELRFMKNENTTKDSDTTGPFSSGF